jgi:putative glutamine amidotransferase
MNQTYIRVLERLGALPVMIPLEMSEATLHGIFERLDGLFLPGGEDMDPIHYGAEPTAELGAIDGERDRTELLLTRWALMAGMPLLGVCRGVQVLNVACGGTLVQDLQSGLPGAAKHDYFPPHFERFYMSHEIKIEPDSRLAHALGAQCAVNSMHHQGIAQLGAILRVVARADDGLPEAVEAPDLPYVVGVQWHPEELALQDSPSSQLFYDFVNVAATDWRQQVPVGWQEQFVHLCAARRPTGMILSSARAA